MQDLVEHPNDDDATLITCGQALVGFIPDHHPYVISVPLQGFIHGQVAGSSQGFGPWIRLASLTIFLLL